MKQQILVLLIFLGFLSACEEKGPETIVFPPELVLINQNDSIPAPCMSCPKKLVNYIDLTKTNLFYAYLSEKTLIKLQKQHPEIGIVWVFAYPKKREDVANSLKNRNFHFAAYYDSTNIFYDINQLDTYPNEQKAIQSYFINGEKIFSEAEPGIPELLERQVAKLLKETD
ncbi:hypothetical protein [Penaeicola halotolerans]|uniref:hypothetical protein n=1 Tax=Penaeicola halotolerans TaxID=2793196 RepID=UPI001CF8203F|nr:hypothetical protein [Penaeicola halotolerans]